MPEKNGWLSTQNAVAFAGGAAAAVVAARILPPLLGMAAGSALAAMGRDPFESLMADHRRFLGFLSAMEQSRNDELFQRVQLLLRLKRQLAAHALAEEDVIYPLLHEEVRAEEDAKHLYAEHAEIKMHLHALEQGPKDDPGWAARAGELRRLVEEHARHEEEIDFPKLRRHLGDSEMARLSRDVHREKQLIL